MHIGTIGISAGVGFCGLGSYFYFSPASATGGIPTKRIRNMVG
jgi:hypothetical protein